MHITLNSFSNYTMSLVKETVLPSLTTQQKKILIIASIAFGCLAAAYVIRHFCFKPLKELKGDGILKDGKLKRPKGKKKFTKSLSDGSRLEAIYKNGKADGPIQMIRPDGSRFEGIYKNGKPNGSIKVTFPDGSGIEGIYKNGKADGLIKLTTSDGTIIEAIYKNDKLNGSATLSHPNGTIENL